MYHKIAEIVQDIENEIYVFESCMVQEKDIIIKSFLNRLKYNLKDIKKICDDKKKEEEKMLEGQHLISHGCTSRFCETCNPKNNNVVE